MIELKAELQKKYELCKRKPENNLEIRRKHLKLKGQVSASNTKDKTESVPRQTDIDINEEEQQLRKSRLALEAKARLYEKITSDDALLDDERNELYMVDFQRKVLYGEHKIGKPESNEADQKHTEWRHPNVTQQNASTPFGAYSDNHNEGIDPDQPVHYQNVQFDEIRDHGTSYFAFSTDEKKRNEQMEELNAMRRKTEKQRQTNEKMKAKRHSMLAARLAKLCERRNIDKSVIDEFVPKPEEARPPEPVDLASIPLPDEVKEPQKPAKVRPWDIGKIGFELPVPNKRKIMSQQVWIEEQRKERYEEFAPPSSYN